MKRAASEPTKSSLPLGQKSSMIQPKQSSKKNTDCLKITLERRKRRADIYTPMADFPVIPRIRLDAAAQMWHYARPYEFF